MSADTPAWRVNAQDTLQHTTFAPQTEHRGRVEEIGDGVAMISGLKNVGLEEVLQFSGGQVGFAQVLNDDSIGCVLLDTSTAVQAGDTVRGTGDVVKVPVGDALLGRVIDPLGRPLDGKGEITTTQTLPIERPAPSIIERDLVTEPVQTGIIAVDTLFALGRGQRELIVGDHATGKTTLAIDTMIAQRSSDMICLYVAVGQKTSSVRRAIDALTSQGNFARCIVMVAGSASAPGLQWIAPYAGMTMAEHFRDTGQHALIVIDDLSKHAATHREIALLTRQSPGREAYPGDVFYLHARLLERAAKLSPAKGGGSLTALPIAETDSGNLSAYIPTNLISITDGQIVLDAALFHQGQKPAVDVGLSVSRVGGKTQAPVLRKAAGTLRLDYAQFLELEVFTRFGGMPDGHVRDQLRRGECIRAILRQPQHQPLRLIDEVALLSALHAGLLDTLSPPALASLRTALPDALDRETQTDRSLQSPCSPALAQGGMQDDTREALLNMMKPLITTAVQGNPPDTGPPGGHESDGKANTGAASTSEDIS
ncbi:F0F1 ATP synthase subunit alpha [Cobetia marina]|uniref:F0F1 ATP synthase subunit alpha n=1 Tax=Cobetia marina TaxID=28258 RepID=UPI000A01C1FD|nr:F0F1 ATP synthase subunit alpha [Cobetia marina]